MQLIDDDRAERPEQAAGVAVRQHERDLLRRGEQDVWRHEALALAARGRRIAGAGLERDGQAHLRHRLGQIAGDIDGKRLQGRDVEGVDAGLRLPALPVEIDQARQEAGERLAAAGWRNQ